MLYPSRPCDANFEMVRIFRPRPSSLVLVLDSFFRFFEDEDEDEKYAWRIHEVGSGLLGSV
jgi:hypothetical protein